MTTTSHKEIIMYYHFTEPFAYALDPVSIDGLHEEVSPEEWDKSKDEMFKLANTPWRGNEGIANYYVLFLDPNNRTLSQVTDADTLYLKYDTKFYNEEILLITPKK